MTLLFLAQLIEIYSFVVLASVLLSWIQLPPDNPLVRFVSTLTEPVLEQIRKLLPSMGGFDFSPLVLLLALQVLRQMLLR